MAKPRASTPVDPAARHLAPQLLDAVLTGELWNADKPERVHHQTWADQRHALLQDMNQACRLALHIYRTIVKRAPKMKNSRPWHTVAVREKMQHWSGTAPHIRRTFGRGRIIEYDYRCVFCMASLNTLAPGGGTLPREFVEQLERHGYECAMRFLLLAYDDLPDAVPRRAIAERLIAMRAPSRQDPISVVVAPHPRGPVTIIGAGGSGGSGDTVVTVGGKPRALPALVK